MLFDFGFFREQTCLVACPYGRFQSVMLDRRSLIVSYDPKRGEPRGKAARKTGADVSLPVLGDCIDCRMCVTTCPPASISATDCRWSASTARSASTPATR